MIARRTIPALLLGLMVSPVFGQTAGVQSFQGLIKDDMGNPINGMVDLEFRIFDAETLGNQVDMNGDGIVDVLDTTVVLGVSVTDGILSTKFGPVSATAFDGNPRWLEVSVDDGGGGGFIPLSRIEMATAPATAEQLNIPPTGTPAITVGATGNVGIGTTTPGRRIHIKSATGLAGMIRTDTTDVAGTSGDSGIEYGRAGEVEWVGYVDDGDNSFRINEGVARGDATARLVVQPGGNVGIGTTSPTEKLDVVGNIQASGTLKSGSSITIDGITNTIGASAALEVNITGDRALRLEPSSDAGFPDSPNVIGGHHGNSVGTPAAGATIAGGGTLVMPNQVLAGLGAIGGGRGNTASGGGATVGGGQSNTASGTWCTIGGGEGNVVGVGNWGTVAGGLNNTVSGVSATVGGGEGNAATATHATVGGGDGNTSDGLYSTVPGGRDNQAGGDWSFAGGRQAKVRNAAQSGDSDGDQGTFIWADSNPVDFQSTGHNQFLIRVSGGVGIGTNTPQATLDVNGTLRLQNGVAINECSSDGMLAGNSDSAVPTEKAVKTYVDTSVVAAAGVPVGTVTAWLKTFPNTPALPDGWAECNGQTLSDPDSPFDGQTVPSLNGPPQRFLRGSISSGGTGGNETHNHGTVTYYVEGPTFPAAAATDGYHLPPYYEVVWIIKVK